MKKLLIAAALFCTFNAQAQNAQDLKKMTPQERARSSFRHDGEKAETESEPGCPNS